MDLPNALTATRKCDSHLMCDFDSGILMLMADGECSCGRKESGFIDGEKREIFNSQ